MRKGLSAVILFLALSLTTVAPAALAEDAGTENLSQDRTDSISGNPFDDNASTTAKDESSSIAVRSTYDYPGAVGDSGKVTTSSYPSGSCGLQVNLPHASGSYSEEIHTRITSFCRILPLVSNTVSGRTYRSRWYGWQLRATLSPRTVYAPSSTVQNYRRTVVAKCSEGTWHRYRTEGFGTISTGVRSYSAAVYEQNDDEIRCQRR